MSDLVVISITNLLESSENVVTLTMIVLLSMYAFCMPVCSATISVEQQTEVQFGEAQTILVSAYTVG